MQLIKRGAEAEIWLKGKRIKRVLKKRVKKKYRLSLLDNRLREKRNRAEIKLMKKAIEAGVPVPKITREGKYFFEMEHVDGEQLKNVLTHENCASFARKAGYILACLHKHDIIHGDFTTSNLLVKDDELWLIDFGLGFVSTSMEDKATDLHVCEQTTKAAHPEVYETFMDNLLEEYMNVLGSRAKLVLSRLEKIRTRGRYR